MKSEDELLKICKVLGENLHGIFTSIKVNEYYKFEIMFNKNEDGSFNFLSPAVYLIPKEGE